MSDPFRFDVAHPDFYKLDKITRAAELAGNPQLGRSCVLISGTNGKGSVAAYLSAWFHSLGLNVGIYISPHVMHENERIQINNQPIDSSEISALEEEYKDILSGLTYFERMTLIGFLAFRKHAVDIQVIEVGIGGRLDATNICNPDFSIISSIGLDHEEVLGKGYASVAFEKAGVMRSGQNTYVPLAIPNEAKEVLIQRAKEVGSSLQFVSMKEFEILGSVKGEHQRRNACLAYRAFKDFCDRRGWKSLSLEEAEKIALQVRWPARIQVVSESPLFIVDGAHNFEGISALQRFLSVHAEGVKFHVIFGMMNDKDLSAIDLLKPWIEKLYFPEFYPERQYKPEFLIEKLGGEKPASLEKLIQKLLEAKVPVLVCGSFYLAGEVLRLLESRKWKV